MAGVSHKLRADEMRSGRVEVGREDKSHGEVEGKRQQDIPLGLRKQPNRFLCCRPALARNDQANIYGKGDICHAET